jgi:hypothetical protein
LRTGLDAEHRHLDSQIARDGLAVDFRDFDRERFELAQSLLGGQAAEAKSRGFAALLLALAAILLAGLTVWLYFQAVAVHSQSSILRLADSVAALTGLALALCCLVFALKTVLHVWGQQALGPGHFAPGRRPADVQPGIPAPHAA